MGSGGGGGSGGQVAVFIRHLVRLTEVCGKVLSEKYAYKSVKTALLLSNVIDADHQNSCLFTNKGHFSSPLWVVLGVLATFYK